MAVSFLSTSGLGFAFDAIATALRNRLTGFYATYGEKDFFLSLLKQLPGNVSQVTYIDKPGIGSWQSGVLGNEIRIFVNPSYSAGLSNPGRTTHHEICHHTTQLSANAVNDAATWIAANAVPFQDIVTRAGSKQMARRAVEYTFEERTLCGLDNAFAARIAESSKLAPAFEACIKTFLQANA